jgi:hypothetical protein
MQYDVGKTIEAHIARYRLVVEQMKKTKKMEKEVQTTSTVNGGGAGQVKKTKPTIHRHHQQQQQQRNAWSPYTLKDAVVTIHQSLKSLEASHGIVPSNVSGEDDGAFHLHGDSSKKEQQKKKEVEEAVKVRKKSWMNMVICQSYYCY